MTLVGQKLGKYEITELIARGGMAHIYKAKQPGLGRDVAIKVLLNYLAHDNQFVTRFKREAESITLLRHPNIIRLFDMDIEDGHYYMVMEYMRGGDLHKLLRQETKLSPTKALDIMIPVVDAIACAHDVGIIHRDIKPCNILFEKESGEHPVITDFGITLMQGSMRLTGSGSYLGTPIYMSPESGLGDPIDHRADIYSLGVTFYELLTGGFPFDGSTPSDIFFSKLYDPLPDFDLTMPHVPDYVREIITTSLQTNKTKRYQSARDMKQAMQIARAELALASVPPELIEPQPTKMVSNTIHAPISVIKEKPPKPFKHKWFVINATSIAIAGLIILMCVLFLVNEMPEADNTEEINMQASVVEWADATDIYVALVDPTDTVTSNPTSQLDSTLTSVPTIVPSNTPQSIPTIEPTTQTNTAKISFTDLKSDVNSLVGTVERAFVQIETQITEITPEVTTPTVTNYTVASTDPTINRTIFDSTIHHYQISASQLSDQSLIVINHGMTSGISYTFTDKMTGDIISWSEAFVSGLCLEIPQDSGQYQLTIQSNHNVSETHYAIGIQDGNLASTECELNS